MAVRSAASADPIVAADIAVVAVPLERTIRLGAFCASEREYAALRVHTASGLEGFALGYTRGLPLAQRLAARAAAVVGADASDFAAATAILAAAADTVDVRASSLVEIALWDLAAKRAEQPLWRLLGGNSERVPVLAVGGYFMDERPLSD
ncbi:MAG TPA: hypothetical protein VNI78_12150, partial [Vicinamibacterales bacterium]|nr:hypothetical protein [Vicinamibacterales bacterium]